jgi:hypothetical protein
MKKIIFALALFAPAFAFAQATTTDATTTTSTSTPLNCMQLAVEKRETSLITAFDIYSASMKSALTSRMNLLKEAWGLSDKKARNEKRLSAYKTFKTDTQNAHNTLRSTRTTTWKTYETDMKACGVKGVGENPVPITSGSISL